MHTYATDIDTDEMCSEQTSIVQMPLVDTYQTVTEQSR